MTSHHVMHHVTAVICLFIIQENQNQNIKSRKINKKKRKMLVSKCIMTHPISIFSLNEHLDNDANNIVTSLHKIVLFVRNRLFNEKTEKNIPYIASFGHATWDLISSIYESG